MPDIVKAYIPDEFVDAVSRLVIRDITQKHTLQEYLTQEDISKKLKVSRSTVWDWTNKGLIKAYRFGERQIRYKTSDVLDFIESNKI